MTCIILEDEIPAQNILKKYLEMSPNVQLLGTFKAAIEANAWLKQNSTDLIFLDINLPDINGIDFMKTIKRPPSIIMTTAYPDFAASSFELETIVDYLVKPFSYDRFLKAVNKVKKNAQVHKKPISEDEKRTIFLNVDKTLHKLIVNDILYIESDRNYISVVTKDKKLTYIEALKNWKDKLDSKQFVQVHKSYIINKKVVEKISGNIIYLHDKRIPIGRTYKQELLKTLNIV